MSKSKKNQTYKVETGIASRICTDALWKRYHSGRVPVIPDIKCKSPGEGNLLGLRDPVQYAKELIAVGAPMISVVTEEEHYGGSVLMLSKIAEAIQVPILRKDFILKKEQLLESVKYGASGVLLMASIMKEEQLKELFYEAISLGLEPLVETHNEAEIAAVSTLDLSFFGINNRNILEWETDQGSVGTTELLTCFIKKEVFILSESSIASCEEVSRAIDAGANGVLVGTAILKAQDPAAMYQKLSLPLYKC